MDCANLNSGFNLKRYNPMFQLVGLPNCVKCKQAKKLLDNMGAKYEEINGLEHTELLEQYKIQAAPVLINTDTKTATYVGDWGSKKLKDLMGIE